MALRDNNFSLTRLAAAMLVRPTHTIAWPQGPTLAQAAALLLARAVFAATPPAPGWSRPILRLKHCSAQPASAAA